MQGCFLTSSLTFLFDRVSLCGHCMQCINMPFVGDDYRHMHFQPAWNGRLRILPFTQ